MASLWEIAEAGKEISESMEVNLSSSVLTPTRDSIRHDSVGFALLARTAVPLFSVIYLISATLAASRVRACAASGLRG